MLLRGPPVDDRDKRGSALLSSVRLPLHSLASSVQGGSLVMVAIASRTSVPARCSTMSGQLRPCSPRSGTVLRTHSSLCEAASAGGPLVAPYCSRVAVLSIFPSCPSLPSSPPSPSPLLLLRLPFSLPPYRLTLQRHSPYPPLLSPRALHQRPTPSSLFASSPSHKALGPRQPFVVPAQTDTPSR